MQKLIYVLAIFLLPSLTIAQNENYVKSTTYQEATTDGVNKESGGTITQDDKIESIMFYDGLGRPMESVGIRAGVGNKDIITHIGYDEFGRQDKEWLPYAETTNGGLYRGDAEISTLSFYNTSKYESTLNPYSEKHLEASPMSRVLEQAAPGEDWALDKDLDSDHTIKFGYQTNSDSDFVRKFRVVFPSGNTEAPELELDHNDLNYAEGELYKTVVKDENWSPGQIYPQEHTTEEFKDKLGRVILKRSFNKYDWLDTYYIYDDYGNLTYVLPPLLDTYNKYLKYIGKSSVGDSDETSNIYPYFTDGVGYSEFIINVFTNHMRVYLSAQNFTYGAPLVSGKIGDLTFSPALPDMTIGDVMVEDINGNTVKGATAYIQDGDLYLSSTGEGVYMGTSSYPEFYLTLYVDWFEFDEAPEITTALLNDLAYQYKYDSRNRLVEKKIPGKDWEYIVYNTLDQPILTQDGNQRSTSTNTWTFTKYDAFSRVVYTGEYSSNSSRIALQQAADAISTKYESRQGSARSLTGGRVYYSNSAFPNNTTNITNLYTVNYYDSYEDSAGMSVPGSVLEQPTATAGETKGLATVSKVKVLTTSNWNTTIFGYDKKGREIYSKYANTYLGTRDVVSSELDFVGKVKKSVSVHTKGSTNITTTDTFSYDHMGRLISQKQKINSEPEELIVLNTYDELGQLESKKVGGEVASTIENSTGLQIIDYAYNVRGWLKQINDPMNALGADLFAFKINYNDPVATSTLQSEALYNGNISETQWKTANDNVLRTYGYKYDALNRITQSKFSDQTNYAYDHNYRSLYRYDKNGNILDLQRNIWQDDLEEFTDNDISYDYYGNKLDYLQIEDGEGDSVRNYDYDANGNMIEDNRDYFGFNGNEGENTRSITYNHLNLPVSISIGGYAENSETREELPTGNISYIYDALGTKLSKTVEGISTYYAGNYIYEGSTLKFFSHTEGYVDAENGFNYVYQYKDHLGNIRLSYKDISSTSIPNLEILEENNYYPFGLKHQGYNNNVSANINGVAKKFKYNGKEYEEALGLNLYEMDWRSYDPAIARWTSIDPVIHASLSPYNAFDNNPIFWNDPSGAAVIETEYGTTYTGEDAKNMFAQLKSQYGGSSSDDESEGEGEEECCPGLKKFFKEVLDKATGKVTMDWDFSGKNYWHGEDGYTYYVTDDNEFYKIYYDRYEKVDELPPMMQYIEMSVGTAGAAKNGVAYMGRKAGKTTMVYLAKKGQQIIYVGITNNFAIRAATHLRGKYKLAIESIDESLNSLSREDARAVEQVLIELFGLGGKKGQKGQLLNRINSIAEKNPVYAESLKRGKELLEAAGIKF